MNFWRLLRDQDKKCSTRSAWGTRVEHPICSVARDAYLVNDWIAAASSSLISKTVYSFVIWSRS